MPTIQSMPTNSFSVFPPQGNSYALAGSEMPSSVLNNVQLPGTSFYGVQSAVPSMFIPSPGWTANQGIGSGQIITQPFTQFVDGVRVSEHTCEGNGGSECGCGGSCATSKN